MILLDIMPPERRWFCSEVRTTPPSSPTPSNLQPFLQMSLLQSIVSLYIISLILSSSSFTIYAQQPYVGQFTTNCENNSSSVLGYSCNSQNPSCQAYLIFRALPPYNTVSSISQLLVSDPSRLSQLNSVSQTATFETNKEVIVPISCSCSGKYYQTNSSYVIEDGDTYLIIANNTYQGLSTCQALQDQNNLLPRNLFIGTRITVPIRCACPTKNQTDNGVKYLLSYLITWGDDVPSISDRFGVDAGRTLEANELSGQDSTVYPFTTLLVPLQNPPSSSQTIVPPPPPTSQPPPPPPADKKKKTWIFVIVGVVAACVSVLAVCIVIFCLRSANNKRTKDDPNFISESFDSYEKPQGKNKPEEEYKEFLNNISDIAQSLKVYKFEELQSATDNFNPNRWIKGSVYRGIINGNLAAIKKMNGDVSKELNVLNKINHLNLIKLSGVCFSEGHWYLVYEYAENGSLTDWIFHGTNVKKVLSWTQRVQIALDVARGLDYLHSYTNPSHVHKDIKSSNVLLDSDFRAKIANFGLARSAEGEEGEFALTRHIVGTKGYMAPEYLENGLVSPKLDVYSFGVVMLELITGKEAAVESGGKGVLSSDTLVAILAEKNPSENLKDLLDPSLQESHPLDLPIFLARLIESCLRRNPDDRPSMDEIVQSLTRMLAISVTRKSSYSASESHSFASTSSETSIWKREN